MSALLANAIVLYGAHSFAQVSSDPPKPQKIPSAWIWEIATDKRTLYAVGEIHAFVGVQENEIDFLLGEQIYEKASIIYQEARQYDNRTGQQSIKLSEKLGPRIWSDIEKQMKVVITKTKFTSEKQEQLLAAQMIELDGQTAFAVESTIRNFSYLTYLGSIKGKSSLVPGLTLKLEKFEQNKSEKKLVPIETGSLAEELWEQNCAGDLVAQEYILGALSYFEFNTFWNSPKPKSLQDLFRNQTRSGSEFLNYWLDNYPNSKLLMRCNMLPRNEVWLKKIEILLNEPGPSIALLVGVGHLIGPQGLIENLLGRGNIKIRRIYSLN